MQTRGASTPGHHLKRNAHLDVQLPNLIEERLDPVVVACFVQQHELHIWTDQRQRLPRTFKDELLTSRRHERRHSPFIKLVYGFQVPVTESVRVGRP